MLRQLNIFRHNQHYSQRWEKIKSSVETVACYILWMIEQIFRISNVRYMKPQTTHTNIQKITFPWSPRTCFLSIRICSQGMFKIVVYSLERMALTELGTEITGLGNYILSQWNFSWGIKYLLSVVLRWANFRSGSKLHMSRQSRAPAECCNQKISKPILTFQYSFRLE